MTEKEKQSRSADPIEHEIRNTENLLSDFGAGKKKAPAQKPSAPATESKNASAKQPEKETVKETVKETAKETVKATASSAPQKSAAKKTAAPSKTDTSSKSVAKKKSAQSDTDERVHASTASAETEKTSKKETKKETERPSDQENKKTTKETKDKKSNTVDLNTLPRSAKPAHQIIPYVLVVLAIFIGISLLLNLFCNGGNKLEGNPTAHWMGVVGYYICYGLFGLFGPAVFVLPFLFVNMAIYWKKYIDFKLATSKILVSLLAMILLGAFIHVFSLAQHMNNYTAAELMSYGAKMSGGGVIGGKLGYFFVSYLNILGSVILTLCLLGASVFYFIGMTPQHLWNKFRMRHVLRRSTPPSPDEVDAETARNNAAMKAKINKITKHQQEADVEPPEGAVEVVEPATKKSPDDKLAPMPIPKLDPHNGSRPYIAADVNRQMRAGQKRPEGAFDPNTAAKTATASHAATPNGSVVSGTGVTATAKPEAAPVSPKQNTDSAVEPIFPKGNETRAVRKMPKEDRNFDLRNVFVDLDDNDGMPAARKHQPLPPEVPMTGVGSRPSAKAGTVASAAPKPRAAAAQTAPQKPTQASSLATPRPSIRSASAEAASAARPAGKPVSNVASAMKAPSLSAVKPAAAKTNAPKPVFGQAAVDKQAKYGLSDEEFEKLEAQKAAGLPKATVKTASATAEKAKAAEKASDKKAKTTAEKAAEAPKLTKPKKYVFPPVSYLHPGEPMTEENKAEIEQSMQQLAETLASFHVRVQGINYSCGPTVTRYEVILAPGVRVRTITNLADDIALALRSSGGVRIEAPIPGTNAVGIEVPNKTRSTIYLRDLIESKDFAKSTSKLSACLGADIAGQPLIFDISKMPHLLVAGTTGSGKSVCINCIIMSLLFKVRPDEVKLILIDPKKVEFSIYKNIPHLMAPVVTLPKDAAGALQAAVEEMERRFEVFENVGVRDIKGYNEVTADDPDMPYMPHMVIIIDELADLMMTARNEVETAICRIAQKARAAGMHLIIGTQRPSADVVTGLIKANVPSSIAFAVKSQIDSRVILDHGGAEALTGKGDMLFVPIGAMRDTRVQGAFVSDKEVEKICEFIRATNGTAQYDEKFISKLKELAAQCGGGKAKNDDLPVGGDGEKADDPKYADAVRIAVEEKRISTSLLQRKLEVGYSRAAKLIDRMQSEGFVSPPDGSKPRSVLITPEQYIEKFVETEE